MGRPAINLCQRVFKTRLAAEDFVARHVIRRSRRLEYVADVREVDARTERVEVLDTALTGYEPEHADEPLGRHAVIFRSRGVYRVGLPA